MDELVDMRNDRNFRAVKRKEIEENKLREMIEERERKNAERKKKFLYDDTKERKDPKLNKVEQRPEFQRLMDFFEEEEEINEVDDYVDDRDLTVTPVQVDSLRLGEFFGRVLNVLNNVSLKDRIRMYHRDKARYNHSK